MEILKPEGSIGVISYHSLETDLKDLLKRNV
jgi:16S rRNA C1402 N4-methylase RsmH